MSPPQGPNCRAGECGIAPWPRPAFPTSFGSSSWEWGKQGRRSDAGGLIRLFVMKQSEELLRQLCAGSGAGSMLTPSAPVLKGLCGPRSLDTPRPAPALPAHAQGKDREFGPRQTPNAELPAADLRTYTVHIPIEPSVPVDTQSVAGRDRPARLGSAPHGHAPVMAGTGLQRCFQHIPVWGCRRQQHPLPGLALALCLSLS